jgi:hypothetical protein
LLKDLENTGLVISDTRSKGQKGYSSEFQLVVDPRIVGELIDKEWWKQNVVKIKTLLDVEVRGSKNDPYNAYYQKVRKEVKKRL